MLKHINLHLIAAGSIGLLLPSLSYGQDPSTEEDEVIELSPFEVNTTTDNGYLASNSLSGSRMNTPLKDTAAPINVLTSEFLSDIGATNLEEALEYAGNVTNSENVNHHDNETFEFFSNYNIRGLPARRTRDYFQWFVTSDNFNVERIEESRGPNSILYGIGSAGGLINSSTKKARLGRSFVKMNLLTDNYESQRAHLDVNQVVLDDKLAIRVNALYSDIQGYRDFVQNLQRRIHLTGRYASDFGLSVIASYEKGSIYQTKSRSAQSRDQISLWQLAGSPTYLPDVSYDTDAVGKQPGYTHVGWIENTGEAINLRKLYYSRGDGFPITDQSIMPYTANPGGPSTKMVADVEVATLILEQKIGDNTYIQLAGNKQENPYKSYLVALGSSSNVYADPNAEINGAPNPYAGGLYLESDRWNLFDYVKESKDIRLTVSHNLDLGKAGVYRFAVLLEREKSENQRSVYGEYWLRDGEYSPFYNKDRAADRRNSVFRRHYVTPGKFETYTANGPYVTGLLKDIPDPTTPGATLSSTWLPFNSGPGNLTDTPEKITSYMGVVQARYFNDRLVFGVGVRRDKLDREFTNAFRGEHFIPALDDPNAQHNEVSFEGTTKTLGVVGHVTDYLSLHLNYSDSIDPPDANIRVLNTDPTKNDEFGEIAPVSKGEGKDGGIRLQLLDGKLNFKLNYYETKLIGGAQYGFGGSANRPTLFTNNILDEVVAQGLLGEAEADSHRINQNGFLADKKSTGYEFSLVGNPTKSWRLSISYSRGSTKNSNTAPEIKAWEAQELPFLHSFDAVEANFPKSTKNVADYLAVYRADTNRRYFNAEGKDSVRSRKHKFNIVTRYTFRDGFLKGLYLGGGYRYRSASIVGYLDDGTVLYGNSYFTTDGFIGYRVKKVPFIGAGMRLQLNIRNLLDRRTNISTDSLRERADGTLAPYNFRIAKPRSYRLSATFDF